MDMCACLCVVMCGQMHTCWRFYVVVCDCPCDRISLSSALPDGVFFCVLFAFVPAVEPSTVEKVREVEGIITDVLRIMSFGIPVLVHDRGGVYPSPFLVCEFLL